MEEAKKMMESSEFKSQMKTLEKSKEFKEAVKKTGDMMKDPSTAARMEAQMEHMLITTQICCWKTYSHTMSYVIQLWVIGASCWNYTATWPPHEPLTLDLILTACLCTHWKSSCGSWLGPPSAID